MTIESESSLNTFQTTMRGDNIRQDVKEFKENLKIVLNLKIKVKWKDLIVYSNEIFSKLIEINEKISKKLGIPDLSPIQSLDYLDKFDFHSNRFSVQSLPPGYMSFNNVKNQIKNEINSIYQTPQPKLSGPPNRIHKKELVNGLKLIMITIKKVLEKQKENKGKEFIKNKLAVASELRKVLEKRRLEIESSG